MIKGNMKNILREMSHLIILLNYDDAKNCTFLI